MTPELPSALMREALLMLATTAGPLFGVVLLTGLVVGILQAATQVNDPAVSALPRLAAAVTVCWLAGGWMMQRLSSFLAGSLVRMAGH